jgi:hypothetical protein
MQHDFMPPEISQVVFFLKYVAFFRCSIYISPEIKAGRFSCCAAHQNQTVHIDDHGY